MAINASIVNTRYARATMMYLFFNSRWYPEEAFVENTKTSKMLMRWWTGVGNSPVVETNSSPVAPTIKVGAIGPSAAGITGNEDPGSAEDITSRTNVRIRGTAFICTPPRGSSITGLYALGNMADDIGAGTKGAFSSQNAPGIYCNTSY